MTAEIDLLPLPEPKVQHDALGGLYLPLEVSDYARACVSSSNEALRAEVDRLTALAGGVEVQRDANWQAYSDEKARAERLAEALREAREYVVSELAAERDNFAGYEHCSNIASIEADLAKIDAALEQENGRG